MGSAGQQFHVLGLDLQVGNEPKVDPWLLTAWEYK